MELQLIYNRLLTGSNKNFCTILLHFKLFNSKKFEFKGEQEFNKGSSLEPNLAKGCRLKGVFAKCILF